MDSKVTLFKISNMNVIVAKKSQNSNFFMLTDDSFIISVPNLSTLLKAMILNGIISPKVLEGILSELRER